MEEGCNSTHTLNPLFSLFFVTFVDKFKGRFNCGILPAGKKTLSDVPLHTRAHTYVSGVYTWVWSRGSSVGCIGAQGGEEEEEDEKRWKDGKREKEGRSVEARTAVHETEHEPKASLYCALAHHCFSPHFDILTFGTLFYKVLLYLDDTWRHLRWRSAAHTWKPAICFSCICIFSPVPDLNMEIINGKKKK